MYTQSPWQILIICNYQKMWLINFLLYNRWLRAFLHKGGRPQVGEVAGLGGVKKNLANLKIIEKLLSTYTKNGGQTTYFGD